MSRMCTICGGEEVVGFDGFYRHGRTGPRDCREVYSCADCGAGFSDPPPLVCPCCQSRRIGLNSIPEKAFGPDWREICFGISNQGGKSA